MATPTIDSGVDRTNSAEEWIAANKAEYFGRAKANRVRDGRGEKDVANIDAHTAATDTVIAWSQANKEGWNIPQQ